jgi:hypothetical protein
MSKRLQVLVEDSELAAIRRAAHRQRLTTAAWVRQALREARRADAPAREKAKLAVVRAAARHAFPTGEIDQVLAEIEQGYLGSRAH